jgi:hypothetical protein
MERKIRKHSSGHCTSSGVLCDKEFRKMHPFVWSSDEFFFFLKFDPHCQNARGSIKCSLLVFRGIRSYKLQHSAQSPYEVSSTLRNVTFARI